MKKTDYDGIKTPIDIRKIGKFTPNIMSCRTLRQAMALEEASTGSQLGTLAPVDDDRHHPDTLAGDTMPATRRCPRDV